MQAGEMRIGVLARTAECAVETIRFYEREGLLPAPRRSEGNYRLYRQEHLDRLLFIRRCRSLDMSLDDVRRLVRLLAEPDAECDDADVLLDDHIRQVTERIAALESLKSALVELRASCVCYSERNPRHASADCGILRGLSEGNGRRRGK